jgi:hypothetical protein
VMVIRTRMTVMLLWHFSYKVIGIQKKRKHTIEKDKGSKLMKTLRNLYRYFSCCRSKESLSSS